MKEKLNKPLSEVLVHPDLYLRIWTVELKGKLVEGLWLIVPMSFATNFFLYYKQGELFLTDNNFDQEEG